MIKLALKDKERFYEWTKKYFIKNRTSTTEELLERLQGEMPALCNKFKRVAKKLGSKAYVGRYLLGTFAKAGWLKHDGYKWVMKSGDGHCTYCVTAIDEIYVLDIDNNRYCSKNCMEDNEAAEHYDSYLDDYYYLFDEYAKFKPYENYYLSNKVDSSSHLNLVVGLYDISNFLDCGEFDTIILNGGDDGVVAAEMHRMLTDLIGLREKLLIKEMKLRKQREKQSLLYTLMIPHKQKIKGKAITLYKKFKRQFKKQELYDMHGELVGWTVTDYEIRNDMGTMYEKITGEFPSWIIEYKCPYCGSQDNQKTFAKALDGYYYCEECKEYFGKEYFEIPLYTDPIEWYEEDLYPIPEERMYMD